MLCWNRHHGAALYHLACSFCRSSHQHALQTGTLLRLRFSSQSGKATCRKADDKHAFCRCTSLLPHQGFSVSRIPVSIQLNSPSVLQHSHEDVLVHVGTRHHVVALAHVALLCGRPELWWEVLQDVVAHVLASLQEEVLHMPSTCTLDRQPEYAALTDILGRPLALSLSPC